MPPSTVSALGLVADRLETEIVASVELVRDERDIWELRAKNYKSAFDIQSKQLREAIDLCIATQVELENERGSVRCCQCRKATSAGHSVGKKYSNESVPNSNSITNTLAYDDARVVKGTSVVDVEWQSTPLTQATFGHVEQLVSQRDLVSARNELDRMLPGALPIEARVEALLLKSAICRASGPEWLLEGLAQCSEALSLCDSLSSLEFLLPKIQYHRGLCHYQLQQLAQAREAFAAVRVDDPLHDRATKYRTSCDDELDTHNMARRRSAFEEHRTISEGFLKQLNAGESTASLTI